MSDLQQSDQSCTNCDRPLPKATDTAFREPGKACGPGYARCPCGAAYGREMNVLTSESTWERRGSSYRGPYDPAHAPWLNTTPTLGPCHACGSPLTTPIRAEDGSRTGLDGAHWRADCGCESPAVVHEMAVGGGEVRSRGFDEYDPAGEVWSNTTDAEPCDDFFALADATTPDPPEAIEGPAERAARAIDQAMTDILRGDDTPDPPEPDSDTMMYLHERYGVEPTYSRTSNGCGEVAHNYRVAVGALLLRFQLRQVDYHDGWTWRVYGKCDRRKGVFSPQEKLSQACDAADEAAREMLADTAEVLGE